MWPVIPALLLLLAAMPADAQPNCKKGIPCGNTCISATKTCRIGTRPADPKKESASDSGRTELDASDSDRKAFLQWLRGETTHVSIASGPFLGSVDGNIYYLSSCATVTKLSLDERIYFKSEEEAVAKGYRRSRAKGC